MNPGATIKPLASKTSAPGAEMPAPIFEICSPSSKTSWWASVFVAGSSTRPFLIRSMRSFLRGMRRVCGSAADEMVKQSHADGEAVRHLLEHAGLRPISHCGINFQAANHGAGMQHQRIRTREAQALSCKLV